MSDKPKTQTLKPNLVVSDEKFYPPNVTVLSPLPTDHPFYAMAGRVASEWSHIEHRLDTIIWGLLGTENVKSACVTSQILGIGGRCKAISALGHIAGLSAAVLKKTRKLMSDSYVVADLRARIVHDPWYIEQPSGKAGQFKAMPYSEMRYGIHEITKNEVDDTLEKIKVLHKQAMELRSDIRAEQKSLLEKHK